MLEFLFTQERMKGSCTEIVSQFKVREENQTTRGKMLRAMTRTSSNDHLGRVVRKPVNVN